LIEHALELAGGGEDEEAPRPPQDRERPDVIKVAIVGRPNVGKSTFVNAILGEERMIAFDQPGTTRDSIEVDLDYHGKRYTLIDTAGIRRRGKVFEAVEKFSVVKTLQAIERANVVVLVVDAEADIAEQDAHIGGYILEAGRSLIVAVNKWDAVDSGKRKDVKNDLERKLQFLDFADFVPISARMGTGIKPLLAGVDGAFVAAMAKLATPKLTRALQAAIEQQQPPMSGRFRPKMRYAHQGGSNPPIVVIHGSGLDGVKQPYKRYLENTFRKTFKLKGTPLRIELRSSANPFEGRKKPLTEKQDSQRRRRKIISKRRYG
ncbi:MAG TPA: ribosome biogenesis GTPase Der, partial [Usitatibacter sp.]|nr:ribosome biogenesis GTPase Der [Usitatibacter sp.]